MDSARHIRETLTAGLFLAALALGTVLWLWGRFVPEDGYTGMVFVSKADILAESSAIPSVRRTLPARSADAAPAEPFHPIQALEKLSAHADEDIHTALDRSHSFIQLYGGVQRLMGRRILKDADTLYTVYKLSDGTLTFVRAEPAAGLSGNAEAYLEFQEVLAERDIPLLYLQAPQKIGSVSGAPSLPPGVTDYGNENAGNFLAMIEEGGADTLDFRETLAQDGQPWTSYFFRTDHHWKPETALLCVQTLVDYLNGHFELELDPSLTDTSQFHAEVYENIFLGSQGKRSGSLYAGVDSLTVLTPEYETDFSYSIYPTVREGPFEESLLFPERLEEDDLFQSNPYTLYSGGDYPFTRITNHKNPDGPKIMLLRDSFGCAFAPFLALQCSELTTVDLRYFPDEFPVYVNWVDPDMIIILYSPGSLANDSAFQFFSEEEPEAAE